MLQGKSWEAEREALLKDKEDKEKQIESLKVAVFPCMHMLCGWFVGAL